MCYRSQGAKVAGFIAVTIMAGVLGCGGGGGGDSSRSSPTATATPIPMAPVTVATDRSSATLAVGASQQFGATVLNSANGVVIWRVDEGEAGGTVTADGVYTAPALSGVYHVTAVSQADPTKTATVTVAVTGSVRVTPEAANLNSRGSLTFQAVVLGVNDQSVSWAVQEAGGGEINASGVYTAPVRRGTYHVIATSQGDPRASARVPVVVVSGNAEGTIE